jgi:hypothetical protein
MDFEHLLSKMADNTRTIRVLTQGVSSEQARWKPTADSWSILEVINHLVDEEREDFRAHLDAILHHPHRAWIPIDPQGWVSGRQYNERELGQSVDNFLLARQESFAWLRELDAPDWTASRAAPWGSISAGDMFASWIAHDLLHMRQLVELRWACTVHLLEPFKVDYAGTW